MPEPEMSEQAAHKVVAIASQFSFPSACADIKKAILDASEEFDPEPLDFTKVRLGDKSTVVEFRERLHENEKLIVAFSQWERISTPSGVFNGDISINCREK